MDTANCTVFSPQLIDFSGQRFGKWTVLEIAPRGAWKGGQPHWVCRCDCGVTAIVAARSLRKGRSRQCRRCGSTIHGHSRHPLYDVWRGILRRCYVTTNVRYLPYGGRGITVCIRWRKSFAAFCADMGPRPTPAHTIERIDNHGNYEPNNCKWATQMEQNRNTRYNHWIEFDGETQCLADWASECNMSPQTLLHRLERGWSVEKALTTPVRPQRRRRKSAAS